MGVSLGSATVSLGIDTSALSQGVNTAKNVLSQLASGNIVGAVATGVVAIGAATIGLGVATTKMAGDFQSSMTRLVTGAGESQSNLRKVSDGVLAMAASTGTSTALLSAAMFTIESSGHMGSPH